MAGMQYYFFPTDFFYPKPQPVDKEATHDQKVPFKKTDETGYDGHPRSGDEPKKMVVADKNSCSYKTDVKVPALTTSQLPDQTPASPRNVFDE